MSCPAPEVADIFRGHGPAWRQANAGHVSLGQLKVSWPCALNPAATRHGKRLSPITIGGGSGGAEPSAGIGGYPDKVGPARRAPSHIVAVNRISQAMWRFDIGTFRQRSIFCYVGNST